MTSPRTPRQWNAGDPEPGDLPNVRDKHGQVWSWDKPYTPGASPWRLEGAEAMTWIGRRQWQELVDFHGPLSEVLPETPEPPTEADFAPFAEEAAEFAALCGYGPVLRRCPNDDFPIRDEEAGCPRCKRPGAASQSVPAVPVSSTGGKETGEAAETAAEALSAVGVGSLSEAIGMALNDTYAGLEFEDPTFESGTMAIMAVLRERLAGWRPPLPDSETEWGVRVGPNDIPTRTDEDNARHIATFGGGLTAVRRTVGPWVGGDLVTEDNRKVATITHRCPADGMLFTPCCATAPFDLPATDRITADPDLVTFRATSERAIPEPTEGQNRG